MERLIMIVQINPDVPKWLRVTASIITGILLIVITGIILLLLLDLVFNLGLIVR